jgi:hypothetical protein
MILLFSQSSSDLMLAELSYFNDGKYYPRHIFLHAVFTVQQLLKHCVLIKRLRPSGKLYVRAAVMFENCAFCR